MQERKKKLIIFYLDDTGTVGTDDSRLVLSHQLVLHLYHVLLWDSLSDDDTQTCSANQNQPHVDLKNFII